MTGSACAVLRSLNHTPFHTALSVANNDDHVDDLTSGLERSTIINQLLTIFTEADEASKQPAVTASSARLRGWDTFTLDYRAPWPVSLVLSRRSLTKYQVRHCIQVCAVPIALVCCPDPCYLFLTGFTRTFVSPVSAAVPAPVPLQARGASAGWRVAGAPGVHSLR